MGKRDYETKAKIVREDGSRWTGHVSLSVRDRI